MTGASPDFKDTPQPEGPAPSPPLSSSALDHASELRISIVCPPHCDLVPWTMSGRCAEGHGCALSTPSHGPSSHLRPCHAARHCHALCAMWTSMWSLHGQLFEPRCARRCPVARVYTLAQPGRRLAASSRAMARALSSPRAECAAPCAHCVQTGPHPMGWPHWPLAPLVRACSTLWWAALGFWLSDRFKLENSFSIFFQFQFEFKL
jgi:hypothetical protein